MGGFHGRGPWIQADARAPGRSYGRSMTTPAVFRDRADAGRRVAARAGRFRREVPVVLGIPAGGVIVAAEVASALGAPLDVLVVGKLGEPGARIGAIAEGGIAIVHHDRARALGIGAHEVSRLRTDAEDAADRLACRLRKQRPPSALVGRTALLVDDGIGSGDSAIAAGRTARRRGAARVVLAVAIAGAGALKRLEHEFDEITCAEVTSAARWYASGARPSEPELLAALGRPRPAGRLQLPEGARGVIVLVGVDGLVLRYLHDLRFATLALPVGATGDDVVVAADRLHARPDTVGLAIGVLGLGPAAEAALAGAASEHVRAIVVAGGRPDHSAVPRRRTTLVIVGGEEREAPARAAGSSVAVVPGMSHDLSGPGAAEQIAHLAGRWYVEHL